MIARSVRYWREASRWRREHPGSLPWSECARSFAPWLASTLGGRDPIAAGLPWMTMAAVRYLARRARPGVRAFEWGSGGSSVFLASRGVTVVSVDHDAAWLERVRAAVLARGIVSGWSGRHVAPEAAIGDASPDPGDPGAYASGASEYASFRFRDYASAIDAEADGSLDLILIDGRARPSCFRHAVPKLAPGGALLWDNAERAYYHHAMASAPAAFRRVDLSGPLACGRVFESTFAWERPA